MPLSPAVHDFEWPTSAYSKYLNTGNVTEELLLVSYLVRGMLTIPKALSCPQHNILVSQHFPELNI